jgi:hypothetical protein
MTDLPLISSLYAKLAELRHHDGVLAPAWTGVLPARAAPVKRMQVAGDHEGSARAVFHWSVSDDEVIRDCMS